MKAARIVLASFVFCAGWIALARAQENSTAYYQAGNGLYSAKNYNQALRYYDAALQADPNMWQAFQGMGNCYYALGDNAKALSNYQRCLSLHRDNPQLAAFVDALRTQMKATESNPKEKYSAAESDRILRQASGQSGSYSEAGPSIGVARADLGLGPGVGGSGFYFFDPAFGIGGMIHLYLFGTSSMETVPYTTKSLTQGSYTVKTSVGLSSLEIVPSIKFKFEGSGLKPYLVGGLGLAFLSASSKTTYNYQNGPPNGYLYTDSNDAGAKVDPVVEAGLGLELPIERDTRVFLEARFDDVLDQFGSGSYIPIEGGVNFRL